jgi:hypothetical protein
MHGQQQQQVPAIAAAGATDPAQRPTAIVPLARAAAHEPAAAGLPVTGTAAPGRDLTVQYALDRDSQRWVATLVDQATGEVITTVPSPQLRHLLAELRHTPIDLHA